MKYIDDFKTNPTFVKFKTKMDNRPHKGRAKQFFAKLARGLMLPIAILPVAGILLGIGGAIGANIARDDAVGLVFANIFKGMSDVVFANLPILFAVAITITFSKDKGSSGFCCLLAYLVFCATQLAFIQFDPDGVVKSIMWFHEKDSIRGLTTMTLGMTTLQTSIFGGVLVGALSSYIYNRFSVIKLPTALDFFSGVRLVPFILLPIMLLLSMVFLIFWPWIGLAINEMGKGIQSAPAGTGGLLYGILGRSLMPFGLHHIPIVLAFQTEFGGVLNGEVLFDALNKTGVSQFDIDEIMLSFANIAGSKTGTIAGDQNIWNFINSLSYNELNSFDKTLPVFDWFSEHTGVYAGRFTQDYPVYLGVCMGIGAAIIFRSEKSNRKNVTAVIGTAMIVSFLTGITEPLEFTFLFCAPWLYYLIYVPLSGFSYMFMELLGAHVGVGFARGFIDLIIYGAIPVAKGTYFYWAFVLALAEGILAFGLFYYFIKRFDIATPGRKDNPMNLITKKQYQELKSGDKINNRIKAIINLLGGKDNISDVSACATRLRVTVNTNKGINGQDFVELGSKGSIIKDKGVQLIFGGEASIIADQINESLHNKAVTHTKNMPAENDFKINNKIKSFKVFAPFDGKVVLLENVPDNLFANKTLGDGIALEPTSTNVNSILEKGYLTNIFETKHAYSFKSINGIDLLLHIGIDSVKLKNTFSVKSSIGGIDSKSIIAKINLANLKKAKSTISPIVVPDLGNKKIILNVKDGEIIKQGDLLFTVK